MIEWEKLGNGKWKVKKKISVNDPDYKRNLMKQMREIKKFCDDCNITYTLADPCPHHLSDSPEHRAKYNAWLAQKKKTKIKTTIPEESKQTFILKGENE